MSVEEDKKDAVEAAGEDSFAAGWDAEDSQDAPVVAPAEDTAAAAAPEAVPAAEPAAEIAGEAPAPEVPAPAAEAPSVSPDEQRRIDNERSMQGRLEAERRKSAELEARLKALESRNSASPEPRQEAAPATPASGVAYGKPISASSVDDDTRIMVNEFAKENPELAQLIIEDSKEGARMRRILAEYGGDHTATAAELIVEKRRMVAAEADRVQAAQVDVVVNHYKRLAAEHPEYADALIGATDEAIAAKGRLHDEMMAWVKTLPYDQGAYAANVMQEGTTDQVSFVIGEFKKAKAAVAAPAAVSAPTATTPNPQPASKIDQRTKRAAESALAVPVRGAAVLPKTTPDKDDFDAGWHED